jgi:hypothetical protein
MADPATNPLGPVPLATFGFIAMQPLCTFIPDENSNLGISADGLSVLFTQGGEQKLLNQDGSLLMMKTPVVYNIGFVCGVWTVNDKIQTCTNEEQNINFVTPYDFEDTYRQLNVFRLYDKNNDLVATQRAIPNSFPAPYVNTATGWLTDPFGGNWAVCLKQDDFDTPNGLYFALPEEYTQPLFTNNVVRINCDLSKLPLVVLNLPMNYFGNTTYVSYKAGLPWTGLYYAEFQQGAYEANFPSGIMYAAGEEDGNFRINGLNCNSAFYYDMALGRALPIRMAQDQYLWALTCFQNQTVNGENTAGPGRVPNCLPTRLLNSATYAQSLWQSGIAINESMQQYGITENYPEFQLANVAFFHGDNVNYYNVLPQDFLTYDIVDSPDMLWVSPSGSVLAVYHDTNGLYYFMIGGSRVTYQSAVYNYRYDING